jgi:hypothetical protein
MGDENVGCSLRFSQETSDSPAVEYPFSPNADAGRVPNPALVDMLKVNTSIHQPYCLAL